jgi:hypothetical protein
MKRLCVLNPIYAWVVPSKMEFGGSFDRKRELLQEK